MRRRYAYGAIVAALLLAIFGIRRIRRARKVAVTTPEPAAFAARDAGLDESYVRLNTLEDARTLAHTAVVMRGGDGEQLYLTVPVKYVACDAGTLRGLAVALDTLACNDPTNATVSFELAPVGSGVVAGADVGSVAEGVWVHPRFTPTGVAELAADVVHGNRSLDAALAAFPNALDDSEETR